MIKYDFTRIFVAKFIHSHIPSLGEMVHHLLKCKITTQLQEEPTRGSMEEERREYLRYFNLLKKILPVT